MSVFGVIEYEVEGDEQFTYEVDGPRMELREPYTGQMIAEITEEDLLQLLDAFRVEREKDTNNGYYTRVDE